MFLRHLVRWPSADIQVKFYGDHPRGTPPSGELNSGDPTQALKMELVKSACMVGSPGLATVQHGCNHYVDSNFCAQL